MLFFFGGEITNDRLQMLSLCLNCRRINIENAFDIGSAIYKVVVWHLCYAGIDSSTQTSSGARRRKEKHSGRSGHKACW